MRRLILFCGLLLGFTACSNVAPTVSQPPSSFGTFTPDRSTPAKTKAAVASISVIPTPSAANAPHQNNPDRPFVGYTHQRADGNRVVAGSGQLPDLIPIDIPLPGAASWVVAIPWEEGSLWAVTLENGRVLGFLVNAQGWEPFEISPPILEPGQPPLLFGNGEISGLLLSPSTLASQFTHPVPIFQTGLSQAFIDINGDLSLIDEDLHHFHQITVNALPDARILSDEQNRLLFLTGPSERYDHGVLGDAIEATSITRIDDPQTGEISAVIPIPDDLVIEGIAPIWADLNGDGVREIIVTVSNVQHGAQILVFDEDGQQIAAGPAIGQGYRWRHQIAVAPFGPNGETEFVDVLTPHLGGVVEFYQWEGDQLKVIAQISGYTSHVIGTRNLDMAVAGDFDGDGHVELLLPNQARTELGAIRRTENGTEVAWSLNLDGQITTNLGAVTLSDGDIAIGIGQENGILRNDMPNSLRIWMP